MREIIYGVWNSNVLNHVDSVDGVSWDVLNELDPGNPIDAIVSSQGFLVFDEKISLRKLLGTYYKTVRENSCGKCTPCRIASILIDEALHSDKKPDWNEVLAAARQMQISSLCGVGQTSPVAIIEAILHFREKLDQETGQSPVDTVSLVTAKCIEACPSHVNIPRYIDYIKDGHVKKATGVLLNHYPMLATCGRVCVRPCEKACRRNALEGAVAIKDLKRYAVDHFGQTVASAFAPQNSWHDSVAVIGAGPAGINCAYHLLQRGYRVEIFEADTKMGGMALRGIPSYRLPKDILKNECDAVVNLGAVVHYQSKLGRDFTIEDLKKKGFKAVFLGVGCAKGAYLGLPDENTNLKGYRNGIDFLLDVQNRLEKGEHPVLEGDVAIVGCGNVAMDCCRVARRVATGAVHLIYRRTLKEAPADPEEIQAAMDEGVEFHFLTNPVGLLESDGNLTRVRLTKMELTEPDSRGRLGVKPVPGSEFDLPIETLIAAIGQKIDPETFEKETGLLFGRRGNVEVDQTQKTSLEGVFCAGDCATGPSTLINALASGQRAANAIHQYLNGRSSFILRDALSAIVKDLKLVSDCDVESLKERKRVPIRMEEVDKRRKTFEPADFTFTKDEAENEAKRCMRCYRVLMVATAKCIPNKTL